VFCPPPQTAFCPITKILAHQLYTWLRQVMDYNVFGTALASFWTGKPHANWWRQRWNGITLWETPQKLMTSDAEHNTNWWRQKQNGNLLVGWNLNNSHSRRRNKEIWRGGSVSEMTSYLRRVLGFAASINLNQVVFYWIGAVNHSIMEATSHGIFMIQSKGCFETISGQFFTLLRFKVLVSIFRHVGECL
jgi:hypothetical protein